MIQAGLLHYVSGFGPARTPRMAGCGTRLRSRGPACYLGCAFGQPCPSHASRVLSRSTDKALLVRPTVATLALSAHLCFPLRKALVRSIGTVGCAGERSWVLTACFPQKPHRFSLFVAAWCPAIRLRRHDIARTSPRMGRPSLAFSSVVSPAI